MINSKDNIPRVTNQEFFKKFLKTMNGTIRSGRQRRRIYIGWRTYLETSPSLFIWVSIVSRVFVLGLNRSSCSRNTVSLLVAICIRIFFSIIFKYSIKYTLGRYGTPNSILKGLKPHCRMKRRIFLQYLCLLWRKSLVSVLFPLDSHPFRISHRKINHFLHKCHVDLYL